MKKFLIFLVAIVAVVCVGLTIFYFVRNDEVINFTTKEIYCNVGDIITKDELGLKVKKRNKKTKYNYNANEEVKSIVNYDAEHGYYVVNETVGGDVTVEITTSNKKFAKFEIIFHIGDGLNNPYNISDQDDLQNIGGKYDASRKFVLKNDIRLNKAFTPIEYFNGEFDGNNHTISNLKVTEATDKAGLFAELKNAKVYDLKLANVDINGEFAHAAALAGKAVDSSISCVAVKGGNIASNAENSIVGGLIGEMVTSAKATSLSVDNLTLTGDYTVGGLIGKMTKSTLQATYAKATIVKATENGNSTKLGGLVGEFEISAKEGSIQQSYADVVSAYTNFGSFIGTITKTVGFAESTQNELTYLIGNYTVGAANKEVANVPDNMFRNEGNQIEFGNEEDNKYFITNKTTETELARLGEYVFYAIAEEKTAWSEAAWETKVNVLPALRMVRDVEGVPSKYLSKSKAEDNIVGSKNQDEEYNRNALKSKLSGEITEDFSLAENTTYDMAGAGTFSVDKIENILVLGNNATIKDLTIEGSLFKLVDNCTIENITFENLHVVGKSSGLFGEVKSSSVTHSAINNVNVTYADEISSVEKEFGGIAKSLDNGSEITDCQVTVNVKANYADGADTIIAGVVAYNNDGGIVKGNTVNATISGANKMAGIAGVNNGSISNNNATVVVKTNNALEVAGIATENNESKTISNNKINLSVEVVDGTQNGANIAGLVAVNKGNIVDNNTVEGAGIKFIDVANINNLNVAGIVASNLSKGKVENAFNTMAQVGNYEINDVTTIAGKEIKVAGIVVENKEEGNISKVVSTSNLAGNYVAGVAINTNNSSIIDQVLVGFNNQNGVRNTIAGDKFVAGVAYEMGQSSKITNIQTRSTIDAKTNDTISSLVVLKFPNGTTIRNAMINNEATGFGTLYKETWCDYGDTEKTNDLTVKSSYNLLTVKAAAGSFTSVVINTAHIGGGFSAVKQSYFNWYNSWLAWRKVDFEEGNFFTYVNDAGFAKSFTGEYTLVADDSNAEPLGQKGIEVAGISTGNKFPCTWEFNNSKVDKANVWTMGDGTTLSFLNGAYTGVQA